MYIFGVFYLEFSVVDIFAYDFERVDNQFRFRFGNDTALSEHIAMGDTAFDIITVQPFIKSERTVETVRRFVCFALESA